MLLCYRIPETEIDACGLQRQWLTPWTALVSCPLCVCAIGMMLT